MEVFVVCKSSNVPPFVFTDASPYGPVALEGVGPVCLCQLRVEPVRFQ